jgi:hypothetical protein
MSKLVRRLGNVAVSFRNDRLMVFGSICCERAKRGDFLHMRIQREYVALACACLRAEMLSGREPSRRYIVRELGSGAVVLTVC